MAVQGAVPTLRPVPTFLKERTDFVAVDFHRVIDGAGIDKVLAIGDVLRSESKAEADIELVGWDGCHDGIANVDGNSHAGIGQGEGFQAEPHANRARNLAKGWWQECR